MTILFIRADNSPHTTLSDNEAAMGVRSVTDALSVKVLTALGYCVANSSISIVFQIQSWNRFHC